MSVGLALRGRGRRQRGVSMIELALVLPVLLILVLGVIDFGRALHYSNVLINISREGANLASRYGDIGPQDIIRALESTAEPLDMTRDGMIYITKITGRSDGRGTVEEQHRATSGATGLRVVSNMYALAGSLACATCRIRDRSLAWTSH